MYNTTNINCESQQPNVKQHLQFIRMRLLFVCLCPYNSKIHSGSNLLQYSCIVIHNFEYYSWFYYNLYERVLFVLMDVLVYKTSTHTTLCSMFVDSYVNVFYCLIRIKLSLRCLMPTPWHLWTIDCYGERKITDCVRNAQHIMIHEQRTVTYCQFHFILFRSSFSSSFYHSVPVIGRRRSIEIAFSCDKHPANNNNNKWLDMRCICDVCANVCNILSNNNWINGCL